MYSYSPMGEESPLVSPTFKLGWKKIPQIKKDWRKIFGAETPLLSLELLAEIYLKLAAGNLCSFIHVEAFGWQYWFPLSSSSMQLVTFQNRKMHTLSEWLLPASRNTTADWRCHLHVVCAGGLHLQGPAYLSRESTRCTTHFQKDCESFKKSKYLRLLLNRFATAQVFSHLSLYSSCPPWQWQRIRN